MANIPKNWSVEEGRDPEAELRSLQRRFAAIRRRKERAEARKRFLIAVRVPAICAILTFSIAFIGLSFSPFSPSNTLWHLMAFPSCASARALGLTPARRGEPGYWAHLDADNDGVSCERWREE